MNQRPLGPEPSALPNCATPRHGADGRIRTADLFITSELLYRLSHISISSLFILQNNNAFVNDATAILSKYFARAFALKIASNQCKIRAISRGLRARQNLCAIFERKRFTIVFVFGIFNRQFGSIAQLGEHLPYKQGVIGSSPIGPIQFAVVAQLAEQLICNQQVIGSSPIVGFFLFIWMDSRVAKGGRL